MYSVQKRVAAGLKAVLPGAMTRVLQQQWHRAAVQRLLVRPRVGAIASNDLLGRTTPISREYGTDRGSAIDRYYIEGFLARHAGDVRGRVLEVHDDKYTRRFGSDRVTRSDVLSTSARSGVTIVADLSSADHVPSDRFDCIILTQTLQYIYDLRAAVRTLHRILAPAGVLLATVPGICSVGSDAAVWPCYWGFRPASVHRLMSEAFPRDGILIESAGNVLAAIAFLHGLAIEEVDRAALDVRDPAYPVTIAARVMK